MIRKMVLGSLLILTGCASINQPQQLNYEGNILFDSSDFKRAIKKYNSALVKAQSQGDKQYAAISMYGLGRSYGFICNYNEAEKWLKNSITLREELQDSNVAYKTQNILELARLYKVLGRNSAANAEFEKAIPLLVSIDIEASDPIGYATVLEDYVFTLKQSGSIEKSDMVEAEIDRLIANNPGMKATYVPNPYPTKCQ